METIEYNLPIFKYVSSRYTGDYVYCDNDTFFFLNIIPCDEFDNMNSDSSKLYQHLNSLCDSKEYSISSIKERAHISWSKGAQQFKINIPIEVLKIQKINNPLEYTWKPIFGKVNVIKYHQFKCIVIDADFSKFSSLYQLKKKLKK